MKSSRFARVFTTALSLFGVSAGLVACGAEVGDEHADIGSTEQALAPSAVDPGPALPVNLRDASSCIVSDGSNKYVVVAGGQTAANGFSNNAYLLDGTTWRGPFAFTNNLPNGSAKGAMISIPGSPDSCLYVGGQIASAAKQTGILKIAFTTTGSPAVPALAITNAGVLPAGTSRLKLAACGSESVAILGGTTAAATGSSNVYVWHNEVGANPVDTLREDTETNVVTLTNGRTDFAALNPDGDNLHFVVGGGENAGGFIATVEAFSVQDDLVTTPRGCKLENNGNAHFPFTPQISGGGATFTARSLLGVYHSAHAANDDTFAFVAGDDGSASKRASTVKVTWNTPGSSLMLAQADDLATATIEPVVLKASGGNGFAFGGSVADYQENDATPWSTTVNYTGGGALPVRTGATAIQLSATEIYVMGGFNGTNFLSSVDLVTP